MYWITDLLLELLLILIEILIISDKLAASVCWSRTPRTGRLESVPTTLRLQLIWLRDWTWAPPTTRTSSTARIIRTGLVSMRTWDPWRWPSGERESPPPRTWPASPPAPASPLITGCTDWSCALLICCHCEEQCWRTVFQLSRVRRSRPSPPRRSSSSASLS